MFLVEGGMRLDEVNINFTEGMALMGIMRCGIGTEGTGRRVCRYGR